MKHGMNFVAMHPLPFYLMKFQKQTVKLLWSWESFQTPLSVIRKWLLGALAGDGGLRAKKRQLALMYLPVQQAHLCFQAVWTHIYKS